MKKMKMERVRDEAKASSECVATLLLFWYVTFYNENELHVWLICHVLKLNLLTI